MKRNEAERTGRIVGFVERNGVAVATPTAPYLVHEVVDYILISQSRRNAKEHLVSTLVVKDWNPKRLEGP